MTNQNEKKSTKIASLYLSNEYVVKHPTLHMGDSPWKISKVKFLLDDFIQSYKVSCKGKFLNVLDVGGGAGVILKEIAAEIEAKYDLTVNKFALDLSPKALEVQAKTNPDLKKALNENICYTSLDDKEIDLTLLIDVLEHVPDPEMALKEIRRISRFIIMNVPLESNLIYDMGNTITRGKIRRKLIEDYGHIHSFDFAQVRNLIERNAGVVLSYNYANIFERNLRTVRKVKTKILSKLASILYLISPTLSALIFRDFIMILVICY